MQFLCVCMCRNLVYNMYVYCIHNYCCVAIIHYFITRSINLHYYYYYVSYSFFVFIRVFFIKRGEEIFEEGNIYVLFIWSQKCVHKDSKL